MGSFWSYLLRLLGIRKRKKFGDVCKELVDGLENETVTLECPRCSGTGGLWYGGRGDGDRYHPPYRTTCEKCKGTGRLSSDSSVQ